MSNLPYGSMPNSSRASLSSAADTRKRAAEFLDSLGFFPPSNTTNGQIQSNSAANSNTVRPATHQSTVVPNQPMPHQNTAGQSFDSGKETRGFAGNDYAGFNTNSAFDQKGFQSTFIGSESQTPGCEKRVPPQTTSAVLQSNAPVQSTFNNGNYKKLDPQNFARAEAPPMQSWPEPTQSHFQNQSWFNSGTTAAGHQAETQKADASSFGGPQFPAQSIPPAFQQWPSTNQEPLGSTHNQILTGQSGSSQAINSNPKPQTNFSQGALHNEPPNGVWFGSNKEKSDNNNSKTSNNILPAKQTPNTHVGTPQVSSWPGYEQSPPQQQWNMEKSSFDAVQNQKATVVSGQFSNEPSTAPQLPSQQAESIQFESHIGQPQWDSYRADGPPAQAAESKQWTGFEQNGTATTVDEGHFGTQVGQSQSRIQSSPKVESQVHGPPASVQNSLSDRQSSPKKDYEIENSNIHHRHWHLSDQYESEFRTRAGEDARNADALASNPSNVESMTTNFSRAQQQWPAYEQNNAFLGSNEASNSQFANQSPVRSESKVISPPVQSQQSLQSQNWPAYEQSNAFLGSNEALNGHFTGESPARSESKVTSPPVQSHQSQNWPTYEQSNEFLGSNEAPNSQFANQSPARSESKVTSLPVQSQQALQSQQWPAFEQSNTFLGSNEAPNSQFTSHEVANQLPFGQSPARSESKVTSPPAQLQQSLQSQQWPAYEQNNAFLGSTEATNSQFVSHEASNSQFANQSPARSESKVTSPTVQSLQSQNWPTYEQNNEFLGSTEAANTQFTSHEVANQPPFGQSPARSESKVTSPPAQLQQSLQSQQWPAYEQNNAFLGSNEAPNSQFVSHEVANQPSFSQSPARSESKVTSPPVQSQQWPAYEQNNAFLGSTEVSNSQFASHEVANQPSFSQSPARSESKVISPPVQSQQSLQSQNWPAYEQNNAFLGSTEATNSQFVSHEASNSQFANQSPARSESKVTSPPVQSQQALQSQQWPAFEQSNTFLGSNEAPNSQFASHDVANQPSFSQSPARSESKVTSPPVQSLQSLQSQQWPGHVSNSLEGFKQTPATENRYNQSHTSHEQSNQPEQWPAYDQYNSEFAGNTDNGLSFASQLGHTQANQSHSPTKKELEGTEQFVQKEPLPTADNHFSNYTGESLTSDSKFGELPIHDPMWPSHEQSQADYSAGNTDRTGLVNGSESNQVDSTFVPPVIESAAQFQQWPVIDDTTSQFPHEYVDTAPIAGQNTSNYETHSGDIQADGHQWPSYNQEPSFGPSQVTESARSDNTGSYNQPHFSHSPARSVASTAAPPTQPQSWPPADTNVAGFVGSHSPQRSNYSHSPVKSQTQNSSPRNQSQQQPGFDLDAPRSNFALVSGNANQNQADYEQSPFFSDSAVQGSDVSAQQWPSFDQTAAPHFTEDVETNGFTSNLQPEYAQSASQPPAGSFGNQSTYGQSVDAIAHPVTSPPVQAQQYQGHAESANRFSTNVSGFPAPSQKQQWPGYDQRNGYDNANNQFAQEQSPAQSEANIKSPPTMAQQWPEPVVGSGFVQKPQFHGNYEHSPALSATASTAESVPNLNASAMYSSQSTDPSQQMYAPHAIVSFGFGGQIVAIAPKKTTRFGPNGKPYEKWWPGMVNVSKVCDHLSSQFLQPFSALKGPLFDGGHLKKKLSTSDVAILKKEVLKRWEALFPAVEASDARELWQIVRMIIEFDGLVMKIGGEENAASNQLAKIFNVSPSETLPFGRVVAMLMQGNREGAIRECWEHKLWAHALMISSMVGRELYLETVNRFADTLQPSNDELRPAVSTDDESVLVLNGLFHLFGKKGRASFKALESDKAISSGIWKALAVAMMGMRTESDAEALSEFARTLWHRGQWCSAQSCYLLAQIPGVLHRIIGPISTDFPVYLGRGKGTAVKALLVDPLCFAVTEMYEFSTAVQLPVTLSSPVLGMTEIPDYSSLFDSFQSCKFYFALYLIDLGLVESAASYLVALSGLAVAGSDSASCSQSLALKLREVLYRLDQLAIAKTGSKLTTSDKVLSRSATLEQSANGGNWLSRARNLDNLVNKFHLSVEKMMAGVVGVEAESISSTAGASRKQDVSAVKSEAESDFYNSKMYDSVFSTVSEPAAPPAGSFLQPSTARDSSFAPSNFNYKGSNTGSFEYNRQTNGPAAYANQNGASLPTDYSSGPVISSSYTGQHDGYSEYQPQQQQATLPNDPHQAAGGQFYETNYNQGGSLQHNVATGNDQNYAQSYARSETFKSSYSENYGQNDVQQRGGNDSYAQQRSLESNYIPYQEQPAQYSYGQQGAEAQHPAANYTDYRNPMRYNPVGGNETRLESNPPTIEAFSSPELHKEHLAASSDIPQGFSDVLRAEEEVQIDQGRHYHAYNERSDAFGSGLESHTEQQVSFGYANFNSDAGAPQTGVAPFPGSAQSLSGGVQLGAGNGASANVSPYASPNMQNTQLDDTAERESSVKSSESKWSLIGSIGGIFKRSEPKEDAKSVKVKLGNDMSLVYDAAKKQWVKKDGSSISDEQTSAAAGPPQGLRPVSQVPNEPAMPPRANLSAPPTPMLPSNTDLPPQPSSLGRSSSVKKSQRGSRRYVNPVDLTGGGLQDTSAVEQMTKSLASLMNAPQGEPPIAASQGAGLYRSSSRASMQGYSAQLPPSRVEHGMSDHGMASEIEDASYEPSIIGHPRPVPPQSIPLPTSGALSGGQFPNSVRGPFVNGNDSSVQPLANYSARGNIDAANYPSDYGNWSNQNVPNPHSVPSAHSGQNPLGNQNKNYNGWGNQSVPQPHDNAATAHQNRVANNFPMQNQPANDNQQRYYYNS